MKVDGCRAQISGCGMQNEGCRTEGAGCKTRVAGCGLGLARRWQPLPHCLVLWPGSFHWNFSSGWPEFHQGWGFPQIALSFVPGLSMQWAKRTTQPGRMGWGWGGGQGVAKAVVLHLHSDPASLYWGCRAGKPCWGAMGDQGSRSPCPGGQCRLPCPAGSGRASASPTGSYARGFRPLSP